MSNPIPRMTDPVRIHIQQHALQYIRTHGPVSWSPGAHIVPLLFLHGLILSLQYNAAPECKHTAFAQGELKAPAFCWVHTPGPAQAIIRRLAMLPLKVQPLPQVPQACPSAQPLLPQTGCQCVTVACAANPHSVLDAVEAAASAAAPMPRRLLSRGSRTAVRRWSACDSRRQPSATGAGAGSPRPQCSAVQRKAERPLGSLSSVWQSACSHLGSFHQILQTLRFRLHCHQTANEIVRVYQWKGLGGCQCQS
mmetsp:Transcript_3543/g.5522  ORF Transcript_3543/g.5522 Transcript_3543/m.5522 type:complete len:251 (-) Transcript_3543:501-1253(-)